VVVGFDFESEIWPMLQELPLPDGSNVGRTQRILNLDIHFFRTLGCEIGRYSKDDGEEVEDYDFREGYDNDTRFFIRQRQPLPMTVLGIVDTVEVNQ